MLEIVAGVDDDGEPLAAAAARARATAWRRRCRRTAQRSWRAVPLIGTGPAPWAAPGRRRPRRGAPSRDHARAPPGAPSAASPITSTAAAATASAKPTSVTSSGRPAGPSRRAGPAAPARRPRRWRVPTVPSRQARPALSEMTTPMSAWKCASIRSLRRCALRIGVLGQQQHAPAVIAGLEIRLVDAGIGQHQAVPRGDDQHVRCRAQHLRRLRAGSPRRDERPSGDRRELARPSAGLDRRQIEVAPLGLGDDLLRHHQDVLRARREPFCSSAAIKQPREVVARAHARDAARAVTVSWCSTQEAQSYADAGDADAGAVDLVVAVDADQHRCQGLRRHGIGQRTGVHAAQSGSFGQCQHGGPILGIIAEDQHVAIDCCVALQLVCSDIVERRHHPHPFAEPLLRGKRGGGLRRQLHARDLGRHQRHGRVDHDLARNVRRDLLQDLSVVRPGNRENDHLGRPGGIRVGGTARRRRVGLDRERSRPRLPPCRRCASR